MLGFGAVRRSLTLFVGTDATVDLRMGVASLAENITVAAESPLVEVTKAQPSSVVEASQLQTLPTITRNFLTLSQLLPGSGPTAGTGKFAFTKFGGVADQRNGYTTLIDGGSVDDTDWGSPTINVTQDAVQEFKVFRNQFDAQYGAALSAVVTVVTKSGTNQFSGSGFYFGRDNALNAKNYFATTKPPFNQTRVGGSFGGPILKNRTHFFAAAEHLKVNATAIVALPASNPFATQENGVFETPSRDDMLTSRSITARRSAHGLVGRYAYDNQSIGGIKKPTMVVDGLSLGANSTDDIIHAHSLVVEDNWVLSSNKVNTLRVPSAEGFPRHGPEQQRARHHPPVVQLGPEQHRAAVLPARYRDAQRRALHQPVVARPEVRRRVVARGLPLRGALQREGRVRLQHRRGVQRGEPGDLAVLDDDPEAGVLPLPDLHRSACSRRTTGASRAGCGSTSASATTSTPTCG